MRPEPDHALVPGEQHVASTWFLNSDDPVVREFASDAIDGCEAEPERIRRLFAAVRDNIRYDPYTVSSDPNDYRASAVIERGVRTAFRKRWFSRLPLVRSGSQRGWVSRTCEITCNQNALQR
jgi:transglutaminase-like putative cysteine protease